MVTTLFKIELNETTIVISVKSYTERSRINTFARYESSIILVLKHQCTHIPMYIYNIHITVFEIPHSIFMQI